MDEKKHSSRIEKLNDIQRLKNRGKKAEDKTRN